MPSIHPFVFVPLIIGIASALPMSRIPTVNTREGAQTLAISDGDASIFFQNRRTVWDIIWSCVSTIFACCWIAVHPNMLAEGETRFKAFRNRLFYMALMIIAPELMICWAITQWVGAKNLLEKEPYRQHNINSPMNQWTVTHGFFLQMGGFVLSMPSSSPDKPIEEIEILTAERLEELVKKGDISLPIVDEKYIKDRSKRDEFTKTIAIGQTSWFLAQCITRKAQGLVTTELELVTIAFAALNVLVFYFWLSKPLDPRTAVKVPLTAKPLPEPVADADVAEVVVPVPVEETDDQEKKEEIAECNVAELNRVDSGCSVRSSEKSIHWVCELLMSLCFCVLGICGILIGCTVLAIVLGIITIPIAFLQGAYQIIHERLLRTTFSILFGVSRDIPKGATKIDRFYALSTPPDVHDIILIGIGAIGMFFGGIHCIGWNYLFPSHAEEIIWHVSSICIAAVPGALLLSTAAASSAKWVEKWSNALKKLFRAFAVFFGAIGIIGVVPYVLARLLLLVEAFISLRDLPPTALLAVRWTSFLPHL